MSVGSGGGGEEVAGRAGRSGAEIGDEELAGGAVPEDGVAGAAAGDRGWDALRKIEDAVGGCEAGDRVVQHLRALLEARHAAERQEWHVALDGLGRAWAEEGQENGAFYGSSVNRVTGGGWQALVSLPSLGQEVAGEVCGSMSAAEHSGVKITVQYLFQCLQRVVV